MNHLRIQQTGRNTISYLTMTERWKVRAWELGVVRLPVLWNRPQDKVNRIKWLLPQIVQAWAELYGEQGLLREGS